MFCFLKECLIYFWYIFGKIFNAFVNTLECSKSVPASWKSTVFETARDSTETSLILRGFCSSWSFYRINKTRTGKSGVVFLFVLWFRVKWLPSLHQTDWLFRKILSAELLLSWFKPQTHFYLRFSDKGAAHGVTISGKYFWWRSVFSLVVENLEKVVNNKPCNQSCKLSVLLFSYCCLNITNS